MHKNLRWRVTLEEKLWEPAHSPAFPFLSVPGISSMSDRICFDWLNPGMKTIWSKALAGPKMHLLHHSLRTFLVVTKHNLAYLLWCKLSPSFCEAFAFQIYILVDFLPLWGDPFPCWLRMNLNLKLVGKCNFLGTYKNSTTLLIQIGIY